MDENQNLDTNCEELDRVLQECDSICRIYVRGDLIRAMKLVEEKRHDHFLFQFFHSLFITNNAMITADTAMMNEALKVVSESLKEIDAKRRKKGIFSSYFSTPNYDEYSEEEVQSEILFLFLTGAQSALIVVQEKSILGLIKAGFMARNCLSILSECEQILRKRKQWRSELSRETFKGAVLNTIGGYKLLISLSPPRILRLLQFLGFDANRTKALSLIEAVAFGPSLFKYIASFELLGYHLQVEVLAGLGNFDEKLVDRVLKNLKPQIEGSGFILMFEGIYEKIKGDPKAAIAKLTESCQAFEAWIEWKSACTWYIMWNHAIQCDWVKAIECIEFLRASSKWSPCVFTYQSASFKAMLLDQLIKEQKINPTSDRACSINKLRDEIEQLLIEAPTLKRTIVGKTVFIEKFVTKRCQIYFQEKEKFEEKNCKNFKENEIDNSWEKNSGDLMLPAVEQLVFWNIFSMSKNSPGLLKNFADMIDDKLRSDFGDLSSIINRSATSGRSSNQNLDSGFDSLNIHDIDSLRIEKYYNLLLMKGVIYHYMDREDDAIEFLTNILENEKVLNLYKHVAPLASLELGLVFKEKSLRMVDEEDADIETPPNGRKSSSKKFDKKRHSKHTVDSSDDIESMLTLSETYLTRATNNYSHYLNETVIHMRSYNAMTIIQECRKRRSLKERGGGKNLKSPGSIASLLLI